MILTKIYINLLTFTYGMAETEVLQQLNAIQSDIEYIKEHMVDVDTILTEDDKNALLKARKEHKEGKTIKLEDLKRELGL
mgnify:CR=1 FL=1